MLYKSTGLLVSTSLQLHPLEALHVMPSADPISYPAVRSEDSVKNSSRLLSSFSTVGCPRCGGFRTTRAHRRSFFEKAVLFRFGYFPWKCIDCSRRFVAKDRGRN